MKHELKILTIVLIRFKCLTKLPSEMVIRKPSRNCQKRLSSPRNCQKKWPSLLSSVGYKVPTNCIISVLTEYTLLPFDEGDGNDENMGDGDGDEGGG